MKVRFGFVSNSSSSSFLIYGCSLNEDAVKKIVKSKKPYDVGEELETFVKDSFLSVCYGPDSSYFCVGLSWDSINDDETGSQFKERITKEVKRLFGDSIICSTHTDAWYDG